MVSEYIVLADGARQACAPSIAEGTILFALVAMFILWFFSFVCRPKIYSKLEIEEMILGKNIWNFREIENRFKSLEDNDKVDVPYVGANKLYTKLSAYDGMPRWTKTKPIPVRQFLALMAENYRYDANQDKIICVGQAEKYNPIYDEQPKNAC